MKNRLKIILGGVLLLVTSIAVAGIIFVPVGGRYSNPDLAPVDFLVQDADGTIRIRTTGLTGEFSLDASDVPPEFEPPASGCARFPFDQRLELVINLSVGVVEGRTRGRISTQDGTLDFRGVVRGNATCMQAGGRSCGQLIVDLEMRGALVDVSDPMLPGMLRMEILGSLLHESDGARWTSLTSNARLGGEAGLISTLLDTMGAGDFCGV